MTIPSNEGHEMTTMIELSVDEIHTIEDLADVVSSKRSMLQPEDGWRELGSIGVARFTRGGHCLGRLAGRVVEGVHN